MSEHDDLEGVSEDNYVIGTLKHARNPVNRFVDLECQVDDSDEEEEDGEDDSDTREFIDDDPTLKAELTPWGHFGNMDENRKESDWDDVVASIEERYISEGSGATHRITEGNITEERPLENITHLPTDDCPLWRIRCKPGLEKEIVTLLLGTAVPQRKMEFAFSRRWVKGWVYFQANPNRQLYELLRTTPGVIHDRCGLVFQSIPFSEGLELLRTPSSTELPQVGKWVQVLKGTYKGDVGYVLSAASWGLELLLVPRLFPPDQSARGSKRKRSRSRPTMALFNETAAAKLDNKMEPIRIEGNIYLFGGKRFQHGLIVRRSSFDSVSRMVSSIPLESLSFFHLSGHPDLIASESTYPRPSEWLFAESDEVFVVDNSVHPPSFEASGVISALQMDSAELDTKEGIVSVPWVKICRVIHAGDFVEVTGGVDKGRTGWVVGVDMISRVVANIIPTRDEEKLLADCSERFEVHVNLLKPTAAPHMLGTCPRPSVAANPRSARVPWINAEVVITGRHSERTRSAIVKDVLCNQPTPSGLRVVVQMKYLNSSAPFRQLTLDYDNVLEASRAIKLCDYAHPESALFVPRNRDASPLKLPTVSSQQQPCSSGSATPMPESPLSSSPAWNPSSRTPQSDPDHSPAHCSPSPSLDRSSPLPQHNPIHSLASPSTSTDPLDEEHILLDQRLLNAQIRVVVTGGKFNQKELTASVQCIDGRLSIRRQFYKTSEFLFPKWVTPKFPNPTRGNSLLVVIKGEHCGKYVRRIYHRYVGKEAIVILSVVKRVASQVDVLTGERLELDVSYLCVCEESNTDDKAQNRLLMNELREEARKVRAK